MYCVYSLCDVREIECLSPCERTCWNNRRAMRSFIERLFARIRLLNYPFMFEEYEVQKVLIVCGSVCLCVCVSVCLSRLNGLYLRNYWTDLLVIIHTNWKLGPIDCIKISDPGSY